MQNNFDIFTLLYISAMDIQSLTFEILYLFNLLFIGGFFRTAHKFAKPFVSYIIAVFLVIGAAESVHHFPGLDAVNAFGFEHIVLQLALFAAGVSCYMMLTLVSIRYSCKNFEEIDL